MNFLLKYSAPIRQKVRSRQLEIQGAIYDLASGRVDFLGNSPDQEELLPFVVLLSCFLRYNLTTCCFVFYSHPTLTLSSVFKPCLKLATPQPTHTLPVSSNTFWAPLVQEFLSSKIPLPLSVRQNDATSPGGRIRTAHDSALSAKEALVMLKEGIFGTKEGCFILYFSLFFKGLSWLMIFIMC